jgi:hypothetical protein
MDPAIHGMIFLETGHALRLGTDKTDVKLRPFQRRAFAQFHPVTPDRLRVELGNLPQPEKYSLGARSG